MLEKSPLNWGYSSLRGALRSVAGTRYDAPVDRLWAPWRGEYVKKLPDLSGCFLCEAIGGNDDRASLVAARRARVCVVLNRYPFGNGHLMVAPYQHGGDLAGASDEILTELMTTARDLCVVLKESMRAQGFNVGLNLGQAGGAGLKDHLHLHVLPRWPGDANFMLVMNDTRVINQSLDALWELLHEALQARWR